MIIIKNLSTNVYDEIVEEVPKLFKEMVHTDYNVVRVVLDDNAIIKTSNFRECVTFDLGCHLVYINKQDFSEIIIT